MVTTVLLPRSHRVTSVSRNSAYNFYQHFTNYISFFFLQTKLARIVSQKYLPDICTKTRKVRLILAMSGQPPCNLYYGEGFQGYCHPEQAYHQNPSQSDMNGSADLLALFTIPSAVTLPASDPFLLERTAEKICQSAENLQLLGWQSNSAKKPKIDPSGPCVVCESEKAGYHFGVNACAACSAFFRRTISENRKYVCRKSGSEHLNCPIDKRHRCYCRACRLQKCLAKGMDPTAVQPHRDSIGSKGKPPSMSRLSPPSIHDSVENSSPIDLSQPLFVRTDLVGLPSSSEHGICEDLIIPKTEMSDMESLKEELGRDCHSVSSDSSSAYSGYDPRRNLIEVIVTEYRKLIERRRLFYCSSSVRDILGGTHLTARPAKFLDRVRRHHTRIEVALFVEFINSIDPFSQLDTEDKVALMKHLSVSWSILDKYYCTMRGGGLQTNRIIHCDGTFTDLDDPNVEFDANDVAGEKMDKETLNKLFITPLRDALREISGPMHHFQMTDVEFCALTAILLFDPTVRGLSDTTRPMAKKARDRVYHDWFAYYKGHNVADASERIGNTMLLLPAVQTTVEKTAETIFLIKIFEIFDYDPIVDDLFQ